VKQKEEKVTGNRVITRGKLWPQEPLTAWLKRQVMLGEDEENPEVAMQTQKV